MIDVHCHLNFKAFADDYDAVITRAKQAGVTTIINVGTSLASSAWAVELAQKYDNLYAIVGIHPHHADKVDLLASDNSVPLHKGHLDTDNRTWIQQLKQLAQKPKVVGIGEIGMDYYFYASNGIVDPEKQKTVFIEQIKLAHALNLPLQIHHRQVGQELLNVLDEHKHLLKRPIPGMFHCFAASPDFLTQALAMGFYIGFDGNSTYPGIAKGESTPLSELIKVTPLERIVIETDSPYLAPIPHRGKRNEPSYAIITAQFVADIKGVSLQTLVEQTDRNVYTIFGPLSL